ncbi:MAG: hypothetical protein J6P46_02230 [Bacteroidales bacterium]|nr:hypothetical protein [Bacteroidales bacterium]
MKRVLALLSLVCALFVASACHFDVNLSVEADATLFYPDTEVVSVGPSHYEGFHHKHLSDYDLEDIFIDLTKHVSDTFTSAVMHLAIYDEISGKYLRDENYAVVYDTRTGHYAFTDYDIL